MKIPNLIPVALLFTIGLLCSCSEFIERSIENKKVILNAPADSAQSNKYLQSFWWEQVDDALFYRLQIAIPSFDRPVELILDSLVKSNKFSMTVEPGSYQWRVRAENGSSQTAYATHTFTIFESTIATQKVQLKLPGTSLVTNQGDLSFSWFGLFGAAQYRLQVDSLSNNFVDESKMVTNMLTPNLESTIRLSRDQVYQWRVRAESDSAQSKWSSVSTFTLDTKAPPKPSLNAPANNETVSSPVNLSWNASTGAKKYRLYIYKSNSASFGTTFPLTLTATSYVLTTGDYAGALSWKLVAIDEAGNESAESDIRVFTVQ